MKKTVLLLGFTLGVNFVLFFCLNISLYAQDARSTILEKLAQEMVDSLTFKGVIMHGGSTPGFRSVIAIFLTNNITVVALTNQTPMSISLYYNKLGNAALSGEKEDVL